MTVFTWLVVLLLLAAVLARGNKKGSKLFIIIAFLLLFAVMGLRDVNTGGSDASGTNGSYPINYLEIGQQDWNELPSKSGRNYNLGFKYIEKGIYEITNGDYQMFITILSFFVLLSYLRFIRKYSPVPIQSVLYFLGLLYFFFLFDALKQAVAMAILLFAFDAIIDRKPVKFVLIVAIASLVHFPALIFLPAYWIVRIRLEKRYLVLLAVLLVVTYVFREQLLNLMLNAYSESEIEGSLSGVRFLRTKAIVMIVIVITAVILRPPTEKDTVYNACLVFVEIAIVFQTFCGYNNIFERLADYYFHTSIILIPLVFENCELEKHYLELTTERNIKKASTLIFCTFSIWRFLSIASSLEEYSGYKFLWQR